MIEKRILIHRDLFSRVTPWRDAEFTRDIEANMGKVFYKLFYHVIWTTYRREEIISDKIEQYLFPFLLNKAKRFHCEIHGCNGTTNHIHLAISIPPAESVSNIIGKLKGSSSYFLNKEIQVTKDFMWQEGFGVLSFAEKDLPRILHYISGQKEHHQTGKTNAALETFTDDTSDNV